MWGDAAAALLPPFGLLLQAGALDGRRVQVAHLYPQGRWAAGGQDWAAGAPARAVGAPVGASRLHHPALLLADFLHVMGRDVEALGLQDAQNLSPANVGLPELLDARRDQLLVELGSKPGHAPANEAVFYSRVPNQRLSCKLLPADPTLQVTRNGYDF